MINEEFRNLITSKLAETEREKRKVQIIPGNNDKLKQIEDQQQALKEISSYPMTFALNSASNDEIEYLINMYKIETEFNLQKINQKIEESLNQWSDEKFLNEVAAYTILNIIDSVDDSNIRKVSSEIKYYFSLLEKARVENYSFCDLYNKRTIIEIIVQKIPSFKDDAVYIGYEYSHPLVAKKSKDFENFKSKFDKKVIAYYNDFIAKSRELSLPFSENIRLMLSEQIKPLLDVKEMLERRLERYKDIDLTDESKRKKYLEEIKHRTYVDSRVNDFPYFDFEYDISNLSTLPFYASYSLEKLDKLIDVTKKIHNIDDKSNLLDLIMSYNQTKNKKILEDEKNKHKIEVQNKYQSKYDRFKDISLMFHSGDYSEGDRINYFSQIVEYMLSKNGFSLNPVSKYQHIDSYIKRQFRDNEQLINEVELKVKKCIDESQIRDCIAKYTNLKKSIFSSISKNKAEIQKLEKEIIENQTKIIKFICDSYAKEGYNLFKEMPFLTLHETRKNEISKERELELRKLIEKDNHLLFNQNFVHCYISDDEYRYALEGKNSNAPIENIDEIMNNIFMNINNLFKEDITEDEILLLCELNIKDLEQIFEPNAFYKLQCVREIITKYNELDDKTLVNDDYKSGIRKLG